ncbi:unnamed protein product [Brassica oleracea var. botrytis]
MRVRTAGACDVGWVFSAAVLSDFVRDWSDGVALGSLTSPNKVVGAWRWRSSALHPLGFSVSG